MVRGTVDASPKFETDQLKDSKLESKSECESKLCVIAALHTAQIMIVSNKTDRIGGSSTGEHAKHCIMSDWSRDVRMKHTELFRTHLALSTSVDV